MPTTASIVSIYPVAQYLATIDIKKKGLYGGGVDLQLPEKIRNIGMSVERIYNDDPTDTTLTSTANYLYALMGKYGMQALRIPELTGYIADIEPENQLPVPYDFTVSTTTIIPEGSSTVTLSAFIGCNLEFTRNNITQTTTDPGGGGSYFYWNSATGQFICYPAASLGESFRLVPYF